MSDDIKLRSNQHELKSRSPAGGGGVNKREWKMNMNNGQPLIWTSNI